MTRTLLWREAVGHELRRERSDRGERLSDVAGRAGVSVPYLSEVERGRKEPSSDVLAAIARALDLTLSALAARVARLTAPDGAGAGAGDDALAPVLDLTARRTTADLPLATPEPFRVPLLLAA